MMVLILENAPTGLRGELTRWLHEPRANVYVGRVSALVRRKLWDKVRRDLPRASGALLLFSSADEPGFRIETHGDTTRRIVDLDGLQLIQKDHPNREKALRKLAARLPTGDRRTFDPLNPPGTPPPKSAPMPYHDPPPREAQRLDETSEPSGKG